MNEAGWTQQVILLSAFGFLQCYRTVGWETGKTSAHINLFTSQRVCPSSWKCSVACWPLVSHVDYVPTDRQTDGRTPYRYITLSARRGQCNKWTKETEGRPSKKGRWNGCDHCDVWCSVEVTYLLTVTTGSLQRAETDAVVYCVLTGSQGRTARLNLSQPLSRLKPFCRAQAIHWR